MNVLRSYVVSISQDGACLSRPTSAHLPPYQPAYLPVRLVIHLAHVNDVSTTAAAAVATTILCLKNAPTSTSCR